MPLQLREALLALLPGGDAARQEPGLGGVQCSGRDAERDEGNPENAPGVEGKAAKIAGIAREEHAGE